MKNKISFFLLIIIGMAFLSLSISAQNLSLDTGFAPAINGNVQAVVVQPDRKLLVSGNFSTVNGVSFHSIVRFNSDGSLDTGFDPNAAVAAGNNIAYLKLLPDGKILLGGYFGDFGLAGFKRIIRLNSDGSLDNTLTSIPYTVDSGSVFDVEPAPNGKFLMCGSFLSANGSGRRNLVRYNSDGTLDTTFQVTLDGACYHLKTQADNKTLIAGTFSTVSGAARTGLVRLNADDSIDASFNLVLNFSPYFYNFAVQPDGKIVAFAAAGSVVRLIRLNASGGDQETFPVNISGIGLSTIAFQNDGKILLGGSNFYNSNNESTRFLRLNTAGNYDLTYSQIYPNEVVNAVAVLPDGKIIIGGGFQSINNSSYSGLARLIPAFVSQRTAFDFDGDHKADVSVFRPSNGTWYLNRSSAGFTAAPFGIGTDKLVTADYDGDGKADIAVYRSGVWYYLRSSDSAFAYTFFGSSGDLPQVGDFDGDGKADFAVFRPSQTQTPVWMIQRSSQGPITLQIGGDLPTDKPMAADYDGDGITDIAVYRNGLWITKKSLNSAVTSTAFGATEDRPVTGDFDGDGKTDLAVFRPSNGYWYIQKSSQGFNALQFGFGTDTPVPADYDGDGKTDVAVFRGGNWYQLRSSGNTFYGEQFGFSSDIPIPAP